MKRFMSVLLVLALMLTSASAVFAVEASPVENGDVESVYGVQLQCYLEGDSSRLSILEQDGSSRVYDAPNSLVEEIGQGIGVPGNPYEHAEIRLVKLDLDAGGSVTAVSVVDETSLPGEPAYRAHLSGGDIRATVSQMMNAISVTNGRETVVEAVDVVNTVFLFDDEWTVTSLSQLEGEVYDSVYFYDCIGNDMLVDTIVVNKLDENSNQEADSFGVIRRYWYDDSDLGGGVELLINKRTQELGISASYINNEIRNYTKELVRINLDSVGNVRSFTVAADVEDVLLYKAGEWTIVNVYSGEAARIEITNGVETKTVNLDSNIYVYNLTKRGEWEIGKLSDARPGARNVYLYDCVDGDGIVDTIVVDLLDEELNREPDIFGVIKNYWLDNSDLGGSVELLINKRTQELGISASYINNEIRNYTKELVRINLDSSGNVRSFTAAADIEDVLLYKAGEWTIVNVYTGNAARIEITNGVETKTVDLDSNIYVYTLTERGEWEIGKLSDARPGARNVYMYDCVDGDGIVDTIVVDQLDEELNGSYGPYGVIKVAGAMDNDSGAFVDLFVKGRIEEFEMKASLLSQIEAYLYQPVQLIFNSSEVVVGLRLASNVNGVLLYGEGEWTVVSVSVDEGYVIISNGTEERRVTLDEEYYLYMLDQRGEWKRGALRDVQAGMNNVSFYSFEGANGLADTIVVNQWGGSML